MGRPQTSWAEEERTRKIEDLLENPGRDEFFFLRRLIGKTPAQVRNLMVEEFIHRFDLDEHADEIRKSFPSRRSWNELDIALSAFGGMVADVEDHLLFVDRMRYVLAALPQKKDYSDKYADKYTLDATRPKRGWRYSTCNFCWRAVPHGAGPIKKAGLLCFEHNLPSTNSTYRRRKGLKAQIRGEQRLVVERLRKRIPSALSDGEARKTMLSLMTTPNDCLPRLVEYLNGVGHDGEPESLLWAFHGPASAEMNSLYRDAIGEYIQEILTTKSTFSPDQPLALIFTFDELSAAEAWLTVLDHDGRRKNP